MGSPRTTFAMGFPEPRVCFPGAIRYIGSYAVQGLGFGVYSFQERGSFLRVICLGFITPVCYSGLPLQMAARCGGSRLLAKKSVVKLLLWGNQMNYNICIVSSLNSNQEKHDCSPIPFSRRQMELYAGSLFFKKHESMQGAMFNFHERRALTRLYVHVHVCV